MCTGAEIAMIALAAAGTATTVYAADTQAKQAEANANFAAEQAEADARAAEAQALLDAEAIRKEAKRARAQAVASAAAAGIDVDSPTAIKIDETITRNAEQDAQLTVLNAGDYSRRLGQSAQASRISGQNARTAGRINQATSLLSGAQQITRYSNDAWKRARTQEGG
jgi:hypothetical protein